MSAILKLEWFIKISSNSYLFWQFKFEEFIRDPFNWHKTYVLPLENYDISGG